MITLQHGDARLDIDPAVGNYPKWEVTGRIPLHAAPWRDEPQVQASDAPPGIKRLAGDFFCMPFCADDVSQDPPPPHGWPANAPWDVLEQTHAHAVLHLSRDVMGAEVQRHIRLTGPVLYQTHVIDGGAGAVNLAHHPMSRMAAGGRLSFSPKRAVITDPKPQYAGHNLWALGQIRPDLSLACEDGGQWDLHEYPSAHAVEDFVILVEARDRNLGWTVLMRNAEDDMLVVLKDPRILPVTMMWVSNGGRDFGPWNGRHRGVLGIEDGIAAGALGLRYSMEDNPLRAMGVPTTLDLGPRHQIRHAMISLPRPPGWSEVVEITIAGGEATLTERSGASLSIPFDAEFFA